MNYNIDISHFKRKIRELLWVYTNLNYHNCFLTRLKQIMQEPELFLSKKNMMCVINDVFMI